MKTIMLAVALLFAAQATATAATIDIYTDFAQWNLAVAARSSICATETFNDEILDPWLTIQSDLPGTIQNFQFESIVRKKSEPVLNDLFAFTLPAVFAFGAEVDLVNPGGPGEGIGVWADLGGVDTSIGLIDRNTDGWWGFIVTGAAFGYVRFEGGGMEMGGQETYHLDNLSVSCVPEPGSLLLMAAGLLLFARRLRR